MHRRLSVEQRTAKAQNPINGLKRLLSYLKPYRLKLIVVIAFHYSCHSHECSGHLSSGPDN